MIVSIVTSNVGGVFAVMWGLPETADFERIAGEVAALRDLGRPVSYVAIMPEDMPRVDDHARKGLMKLTEQLSESCACVCVILETTGFRGAILRSMMTALNLVTRKHDRVRFVDSAEAAMSFLSSTGNCTRDEVAQAIEELRTKAAA